MTGTDRESRGVDRHVLAMVAALLAGAILVGTGQWLWLKLFTMNADTAVRRLGRALAPEMAASRPFDSRVYRNFIAENPRVGYIVAANYRTGYRHGLTNLDTLENGAADLVEDFRQIGEERILARLVQPGAGFPGEYLHVVSAVFVPSDRSADVTPMGVLKVGFVIPGSVKGLPPFGRGYRNVIWVIWGVAGVLSIFLLAFGFPWKAPRNLAQGPSSEDPTDELSWLESDPGREESFFIDHDGISWKVLFDGAGIEAWNLKGQVYLSEGEMVLRPWGSSAVTEGGDPNYAFRVCAKKIAGPDGFVLLFPCGERFLSWVIGGWGNRRSEVVGYPQTARPGGVERNRWVQIEVRLKGESLEGFMDGERVWELSRADVGESSPDVGFQQGLGVATWSTLARFREARYRVL